MARSRSQIAQIASQLVVDHHDAFLISLLGPEASNLGGARIKELIDAGVIGVDDLSKIMVSGADCDYIEFLHHVNEHLRSIHGDLDEIARLRSMGLDAWMPIIRDRVDAARATPAIEPDLDGGTILADPVPTAGDTRPDTPATGIAFRPEAPPGIPRDQAIGYMQSLTRAGEYARGLGQEMAGDLRHMVIEDGHEMEDWEGEQITREVDPEKRAEILQIIQEETAREFLESRDARALARKLANRTQNYAHNWERIARTELQASYNDARFEAAVNDFGSEAKIARIHEANACDDCIRLFGPSPNPVIFTVQELFENGTNVGKTRKDWRPTIFPVHPNCRCDVVVVPPGFTIKDGDMVRIENE